MANEKVIAFIDNAKCEVVEAVSKKGNTYKVFRLIYGKDKSINLGFVSAQQELALLKSGIKFID